MWKSCPYCREYSFDEEALVGLVVDFTPRACKQCGKLVRNDRLRQLLIIPAMLMELSSARWRCILHFMVDTCSLGAPRRTRDYPSHSSPKPVKADNQN